MEVTPSGIVTDVKLEQPSNACWPMEITPSGIIRVLSLSFDIEPSGHFTAVNISGATPLNAEYPIEVTLEGIVTEVKPVQPENAEAPIEVTPSGIVTEVKPPGHATSVLPSLLQRSPFTTEKYRLFESTTKEVKLEQPENAPPPMEVTLEGIVTEVKS